MQMSNTAQTLGNANCSVLSRSPHQDMSCTVRYLTLEVLIRLTFGVEVLAAVALACVVAGIAAVAQV